MGFCGFSPKISAIIAGLLTLLQGLFWSILGILSLLLYSCSINASEELTPQFYRLYLVYLYSGECSSVEIEVQTENGTIFLPWPEMGSKAAYRTYSWILVYLILSIFWVIGSLLLFIATVSNIRGIRGVLLRSPWLVLTSVFVILDVITAVFYTIDISYTGNLEDLLNFIGLVTEPSDAINSSSTSSTFGYLTMAPSVLAAVIFSRLVLGWVLNLILLVHVSHDAKNDETKPITAPPEPRQPYKEYLKKLSTVGPIPDVQWDPYQRKRSDLPVMKPLKVPSPTNERKRKQSDYQQYLFYAKNASQSNYLDDIRSEPPTPAVVADPKATYVGGSVAGGSTSGGESSYFNIAKDDAKSSVPAPDV